ncbi:MAG: tRNA 2-thiouridine(34) synthase MnmA [Candidatus Kerfeldbacteria bacterium RIFCSPHIGHO2_02_FULL_42_14]|uniref:tRNA-specific 2-thiouridylase MnmA n=1 Tax=Candidatus Kerfeldbacteria bacterium RIFCSPHIGHO2_02_FULL_42_14 TaxID=1798540 RepID=A0A1G2APY8_9BACT|nr:MAG: tRNA 2-thiouridine(34) synthase MnmA [Candidatus Kerfeldbacteria bacterium RIFCSPHIGHO2_02_FULL_42_14]OGY82550.1 MAG: tRNA 2-thiouridine(34) synthase MnmA [Candidatus Kerfeldbacteria bacterium RIFCSPLOWO2_02_FULL_42_19]OGY85154.1 MAG: tRNA 2-thiouridine(34) synthase MnmA [Candidatus Kerfeldbacteria bacterium RIFCSPLOWO2_12_FULL_43_9]
MKFGHKKKVIVAMSGGVDSSVAALLLQQQGYDVTGVFMKNWSGTSLGLTGVAARQWENQCPWERDAYDVRRVCQRLHIPYYTFNFEKEYKDAVLDYFFREYRAGRTPNPDIMCNKEIKFKVFLEKALSLGVDAIATGHYARCVVRESKFEVHIPHDRAKDQTYFLYTLTQAQLAHTLFPLADYTKSEVRALARQTNLPTHNKPDSQGICFVGEVDIRKFLETTIARTPGAIVSVDNEVIGVHQGLAFYTIGQREGLNIDRGGPWYVVDKRVDRNKLIVACGAHHKALFSHGLLATQAHWISLEPTQFPLHCLARIRYRQTLELATVQKSKESEEPSRLDVQFSTPQRAITPGQSIVFYDGDHMLGGAVIEQSLH